MGARELLVSLDSDGGTAAVLRDHDGFWLTGDITRGGGTGLEGYQPSVEGVSQDRTVQGGLLPPGAVAAEVVDDAGTRQQAAAENGAWVIVLDQPTEGSANPVRFTDAAGDTVRAPLPDAWPRSSVDDADQPCPACGARGWEEVHPLDDSRGTRGEEGWEEPTPIVVCRTCGHEESVGVWLRIEEPEDEDPEERERRVREFKQEQLREQREVLAGVDFPIYAADGWSARFGGWGGGDHRPIHSVAIQQGAPYGQPGPTLWIETESEDSGYESEPTLVRRALEDLLYNDNAEWPQRSEGAMTVWLHAREREVRALVARARMSKRELPVEGRPQTFELGELEGHWAAVWRSEKLVVTVAATGVRPDSVTLRQVSDPSGELLDDSVD